MLYRYLVVFAFFISSVSGNELRVITTEYHAKLGMFAAANQVLGQLYLFETGQLPNISGLSIDFDKYGLYYDQNLGTNWWSYYFEPINLGEQRDAKKVYPTYEQYVEAWFQRKMLSREIAAQLVKKYIHIKPHIQQQVDAFVAKFFLGAYVIGIHYRGTDKNIEAPRIAYETVFEEIDKHLPQGKPYSLFIATDEIDFLEQARKKYGSHIIAIEAHRANYNSEGVHFSNKNSYIIGEEALIDACLLSKCDLLIRTSSNLSLWSTYLNPDLPIILLNQRYMETLEPE
jgi:hypothetical protein